MRRVTWPMPANLLSVVPAPPQRTTTHARTPRGAPVKKFLVPVMLLALLYPATIAHADPVQEFNVQLKDVKPDGRYTIVFTANSFDTSGEPPPLLTSNTVSFAAGVKIKPAFLTSDVPVRRQQAARRPADRGRERLLLQAPGQPPRHLQAGEGPAEPAGPQGRRDLHPLADRHRQGRRRRAHARDRRPAAGEALPVPVQAADEGLVRVVRDLRGARRGRAGGPGARRASAR